jgi:hypothetical protein
MFNLRGIQSSFSQLQSNSRQDCALAFLTGVVAITCAYTTRIADPDLWGHLLYGRFFLENGVMGIRDPYSYTANDSIWHVHEYLSQILLSLVYERGGVTGLILLKCAIACLTMYLVYKNVRLASDNPRIWLPIVTLTFVLIGRFFLFRPQLFTLLGFALTVNIVLGHVLGKSSRLWTTPLIIMIWANLHGGFIAGIGAICLGCCLCAIQSFRGKGISIAGFWKSIRLPLAALLACVCGSLVTPMGARVWPFLATELGNRYNRFYINEWKPISLASATLNEAFLLLMMALTIVAAVLAQLHTKRIERLAPWHLALSCLPLAIMTICSVRHTPILLIWLSPIFALLAQSAFDSWPDRNSAKLVAFLVLGPLLCYPAAAVYFTWKSPAWEIKITDLSLGKTQPFGAVEFIKTRNLQGKIYAPLWWGSYISWNIYPAMRVSMDGRNDTLYPVAMVGENLAFFSGAKDKEAPFRSGADYLLVPQDSRILPSIEADEHWIAIFADPDSIIFRRADATMPQSFAEPRPDAKVQAPKVSMATFR